MLTLKWMTMLEQPEGAVVPTDALYDGEPSPPTCL